MSAWLPLQLASHYLTVSHVGLPSIRLEPLRTSFDQRAAARPQRGAGLRVAPTDDGRDVAESVCGGVVRRSPAARRISRLGGGTQGCAQRLLRSALVDLLRPLCCSPMSKVQSPKSRAGRQGSTLHAPRFTFLPAFPLLLRPRIDEQADAGDLAVRPVAAGLLAVASL